MQSAAIHFGEGGHLLDHIAPLAFQLGVPLYLDEAFQEGVAFYPQTNIMEMRDLNMRWGELSQKHDALIRCIFWPPHLKQMLFDLYGRDIELIFCPHGQSDKGFHCDMLKLFGKQEKVFLYGLRMKEMLEMKGIWPEVQNYEYIGNYRLAFYEKHRDFYDELAEKEIFSKFSSKKPILLYAPTWKDYEESTSFFTLGRNLIEETSDNWNLLIKPHPHLEGRNPELYYSIAALAEKRKNTVLLEHFPPIYPILSRADVFVGDFSSIGYDFLYFKRPMFFLNETKRAIEDPSRRLHRCGVSIESTSPMKCIEKHLPNMQGFISEQQRLYNQAFQ